jgi:hypothetical protein
MPTLPIHSTISARENDVAPILLIALTSPDQEMDLGVQIIPLGVLLDQSIQKESRKIICWIRITSSNWELDVQSTNLLYMFLMRRKKI